MREDYRPAEYQIEVEYVCQKCNRERHAPANFNAPECCGEEMMECGQIYPANTDEWEEQRDPDGEWRQRRD